MKVPGSCGRVRAGQGKAGAKATELSLCTCRQQLLAASQRRFCAQQRGLCAQQRVCANFFSHPNRIWLATFMWEVDYWLGFARVTSVSSKNGRRGQEARDIVCFSMLSVRHPRDRFNQPRSNSCVAAAAAMFLAARPRRLWAHERGLHRPRFFDQNLLGSFNVRKFKGRMRMDVSTFEYLCSILALYMLRQDTIMRLAVPGSQT